MNKTKNTFLILLTALEETIAFMTPCVLTLG